MNNNEFKLDPSNGQPINPTPTVVPTQTQVPTTPEPVAPVPVQAPVTPEPVVQPVTPAAPEQVIQPVAPTPVQTPVVPVQNVMNNQMNTNMNSANATVNPNVGTVEPNMSNNSVNPTVTFPEISATVNANVDNTPKEVISPSSNVNENGSQPMPQNTNIINPMQYVPTVEQSKQAFIDSTQNMSNKKKEEKKSGVNFAFIIGLFVVLFAAIVFVFPLLLKYI